MEYEVPFHVPSITEEDADAVLKALRSRWLTTGPIAEQLEDAFCRFVGAKHAVSVSSASAGLWIALRSHPKPRGYVLTTPMTFIATALAIHYAGHIPIFLDIDDDFHFDRSLGFLEAHQKTIEEHFGLPLWENIVAVLPVYYGGWPCDPNRYRALAHSLPQRPFLVEDAAHAFPTYIDGKVLGWDSHLIVYSFYATKTITAGEGGMILTDDSTLYEKLIRLRQFGIDRHAYSRHRKGGIEYDVVEWGYKWNLPDLLASLALSQLRRAEEMRQKRKQIAKIYEQGLQRFREWIRLPPHGDQSSYHLYPIVLTVERAREVRDRLHRYLLNHGIQTSLHFVPIYRFTAFRDYPLGHRDYPRCEQIYSGLLSLPIYPDMQTAQAERVVWAIGSFFMKEF